MHPVTVELVLYSSLVSVLLASVVGMFWAWGWALRQLWTGRGLLENVRISSLREAPWGAPTILAVVLLYVLVNLGVTRSYSTLTGRQLPRAAKAVDKKTEAANLEKEAKDKATEKPPVAEPAPATKADADREAGNRAATPDDRAKQTETELLGQLAVINALLLILVPALVFFTSQATLTDFGLNFRNWREQIAVGGVAALLMTPAVLAVQSVAIRIWPPHKHPVEDMILEEFTGGVAVLAVLSTMVLAPMIEELLFRGVVQRWLTRLLGDRRNTPVIVDDLEPVQQIAVAWADEDPYQPPKAEFQPLSQGKDAQPAEFSTTAIVLTSFLFAAMHLPQWPSPIGIFLLSLALGAVYQKTGSLIATITMHGVFNGFSTIGLLLIALSRHLQPPQAGGAHGLITHLQLLLELASALLR